MAPLDREASTLIRAGGFAALALGLSYLAITALYAVAGSIPSDEGSVWLEYLADKQAAWWGIAGLSVLTDILFLPMAAALYLALRVANRNLILAGASLLVLFAILDLAVTWSNYAALLVLSADYAATTDDAVRATLAAAASYATSVLGSTLFGVYVIVVPGLGVLAIGVVMLQSGFSRIGGIVGVLTGVLAMLAVLGAVVWPSLDVLVIPTALLTTMWVLIAGYRLLVKPAEPGTLG